ITSACPRVAGAMSMKAIVRSSSSTIVAGSSPARILQKMQSGSDIGESLLAGAAALPAPREGARVVGRAHLAGELRLGKRLDQLPQRRPRRHLELARQLVAAQQRWRRSVLVPAQCLAEQRPGEAQVRVDR